MTMMRSVSPNKIPNWQKWKLPIILGILVFLFFITLPPAQAVEMTATQVSSYSFDAPAGTVIYQILIDAMPMGTNQTHTLTCGGATYLLTIQSSNPYSVYYDFDIGWTYPNGTTTTIHKSITRLPGATYKTNIQPVYSQLESAYNVMWAIDLEIGTTNTSVYTGINSGPAGWSASDAIPFTSVEGEFGGYNTNVYLYDMSVADFQKHVVEYDSVYGLKNLGANFFSWAWDQILAFINNIPIIGPQFVSIITILGGIVAEILSWIVWIITNLPMIMAAVEVTIFVCAFLFAEKNPKPETVIKNIFKYNVAAVTGFIWLFNLVYTWIRGLVELVAHVVGALKPL
jgi:hypothetical protein